MTMSLTAKSVSLNKSLYIEENSNAHKFSNAKLMGVVSKITMNDKILI